MSGLIWRYRSPSLGTCYRTDGRYTIMWKMPNRGTSVFFGGSDITFLRHRRVVVNLSVRLASFI